MQPTQRGATPGGRPLETQQQNRLDDLDSAKYRKNTKTALDHFAGFLEDRGIDDLANVEYDTCRKYARHLRRRTEEKEKFAPISAHQYFSYVRACLSWAVDEQLIDTNPAARSKATDPLPEVNDDTRDSQQFWRRREMEALCATTDRQVDESFEDDGIDTDLAFRNRALVYTLIYSALRAGELVRTADDEKRHGLRWGDVDLETGTLYVFGKDRSYEDQALLSPAHEPLRRWRQRCEYTDDEHAVFPRLDNAAGDPPTSISDTSLRTTIDDLVEWSEYEFERNLDPHGARRGLGRVIYRESAETAQDLLRHADIRTTHESYSDEQASTTRERAEDLLFSEDG